MKIRVIPSSGISSNCYLLISGTHAAVVDPSVSVSVILNCASAEGVQIDQILLTHGHFDHIFAVDELVSATGAKLCVHKYDSVMLPDPEKNCGAFFGIDTTVSSKPDVLLSNGDILSIGDESLTVLHTPGHSAGSVCYMFDDVLVSGDTLFAGSFGRYDFPDSSVDDLFASLDKLLALPENLKVYPGHGGTTTIARERQYNMYLRYKK